MAAITLVHRHEALGVSRQRLAEELGQLAEGACVNAGPMQQLDPGWVAVLAAVEHVRNVGVDQQGGAEDARAMRDESPLALFR